MSTVCQPYVSHMSALWQHYVSSMPALFQTYIFPMSALCLQCNTRKKLNLRNLLHKVVTWWLDQKLIFSHLWYLDMKPCYNSPQSLPALSSQFHDIICARCTLNTTEPGGLYPVICMVSMWIVFQCCIMYFAKSCLQFLGQVIFIFWLRSYSFF